jgi:3'(2'), 5'-bisphosphate nucleotidase
MPLEIKDPWNIAPDEPLEFMDQLDKRLSHVQHLLTPLQDLAREREILIHKLQHTPEKNPKIESRWLEPNWLDLSKVEFTPEHKRWHAILLHLAEHYHFDEPDEMRDVASRFYEHYDDRTIDKEHIGEAIERHIMRRPKLAAYMDQFRYHPSKDDRQKITFIVGGPATGKSTAAALYEKGQGSSLGIALAADRFKHSLALPEEMGEAFGTLTHPEADYLMKCLLERIEKKRENGQIYDYHIEKYSINDHQMADVRRRDADIRIVGVFCADPSVSIHRNAERGYETDRFVPSMDVLYYAKRAAKAMPRMASYLDAPLALYSNGVNEQLPVLIASRAAHSAEFNITDPAAFAAFLRHSYINENAQCEKDVFAKTPPASYIAEGLKKYTDENLSVNLYDKNKTLLARAQGRQMEVYNPKALMASLGLPNRFGAFSSHMTSAGFRIEITRDQGHGIIRGSTGISESESERIFHADIEAAAGSSRSTSWQSSGAGKIADSGPTNTESRDAARTQWRTRTLNTGASAYPRLVALRHQAGIATAADMPFIAQLARETGEMLASDQHNVRVLKTKDDNSLYTTGDKLAHESILQALNRYYADIPVVSEENEAHVNKKALESRIRFDVDPLDNTSSYVNQLDGYSVNIARVEDGKPVSGAMYFPARNELYFTGKDGRAYLQKGDDAPIRISVRRGEPSMPLQVAIGFRPPNLTLLESFKAGRGYETQAHPGQYRICQIAKGECDLTGLMNGKSCNFHSWDIAAAHAILLAAGGFVVTPEGEDLSYPGTVQPGPHISGTKEALQAIGILMKQHIRHAINELRTGCGHFY